ncbi:MAG: hypothetical protein WCC90_14675, partial [Methylocella sp.]
MSDPFKRRSARVAAKCVATAQRALLVAALPVSGRARALEAEYYRFSASRAPGVGSANSIT